jgi:signal peptidase I
MSNQSVNCRSIRVKLLALLGIVGAILVCLIVILRIFGFLRLGVMAMNSDAPTLTTGDHIVCEDLSFHWRNPRRGEFVFFRTDGLRFVNAPLYAKRVIGLPGEQVGITNGELYIDGALMVVSNAYGPIRYLPVPSWHTADYQTNMLVPSGQYFVLGDNPTKSLDSRYFGCVPATNIIGRVYLCCWPPQRVGFIK